MATGADYEKTGKLYLNEEMSDFAIIVDSVVLPAHRYILAQRCEYFNAMFESGMIETTSNRIEVRETSIDGVKLVLKWIYTGETDNISIDNAFEVIRLAHMYQIEQIVDKAVDCFVKYSTVENVCLILNEAVFLSLDELMEFAIQRVKKTPIEVLKQESFKQLSANALNVILTRCLNVVSDNDIFHAVINWMKANLTRSTDFPGILMNVDLSTLTIKDLAAVPADVLDAQILVEIYRQQEMNNTDPVYKIFNENVAVPKYGVIVVTGGKTAFFNGEIGMLSHQIRHAEGIIIDLSRRYMLNYIKMELAQFSEYLYFIEVSEDNVNWTRVIDHLKYPCCNLQNLYFETRPVRFIRICGTASAYGFFNFNVSRFEAYCTNKTFETDPVTTLVIPSDNIAIPGKTAMMIRISCPEIVYDNISGTSNTYYNNGIMVQLYQPYLIGSLKLDFYDDLFRAYRYIVEVSVDRVYWTRVFVGENNALGKIIFDKRPVAFIKFTGLYDHALPVFQSYRFECPAVSE